MVRLKVKKIWLDAVTLVLFQFLNGAIKSIDNLAVGGIVTIFQFLNGAIKRDSLLLEQVIYWNFNSSMVRLKAKGTGYTAQSKYISIPQWCD